MNPLAQGRIRSALAALPLVLLACGGETKPSSSGTGGSSGAGASGTGTGGASGANGGTGEAGTNSSGAGSGGEPGSACPGEPPTNDSPCSLPSAGVRASCSYGDDPRPSCRTTAACMQDHWLVTPPDATQCTEPPLPSACPPVPATVGDPCSDSTLKCWYDDGTHCECSPCRDGREYPICQTIDPPEWACGTPPAECPNPLPQAGEPCSDNELSCGPSCEEPIRCDGTRWLYDHANCPICAAPDTPIATPGGDKAIAELRPGDLVYSVDDGAIVAVPLLRTGNTPVTRHRVVRVLLDDGRALELSPGHPTADGRHFSELVAGSALDERHAVVSAELVPYAYERTYDILPASSTGTYFAAGALIGSTLHVQPPRP